MNRPLASIVCLLFALILTACGGQLPTEPVATPTVPPAPTETPIPSPTSTSTSTATPAPTDTLVPGPASLAGSVSLSNGSLEPFDTTIEVRQEGTFDLVGSAETDAGGVFNLVAIQSGEYELWVLVTLTARMLPGCDDLLPPDDSWSLGVEFGPDRGMTMENGSLMMGLFLVENLQSSDLRATGFYMVLPELEIIPGIENTLDIVLQCR